MKLLGESERSFVRKITGSFVAVFILGCAHGQTLQEKLKSKVGKNIDEVISANGSPTSTYPVSTGNKIYIWKSAGQDPSKNGDCDIQYETDTSGVIVAATHQGSCK